MHLSVANRIWRKLGLVIAKDTLVLITAHIVLSDCFREAAEPNTGVFYTRSTARGIALYYRWLQKLVDENFVNDQVVLKFSQLDARLSLSCNEKLASLDNNVAFQNKRANSHKNASTTPTICFLNEFLFQNGKMINHCATGKS